jgi:hypothetical protein
MAHAQEVTGSLITLDAMSMGREDAGALTRGRNAQEAPTRVKRFILNLGFAD